MLSPFYVSSLEVTVNSSVLKCDIILNKVTEAYCQQGLFGKLFISVYFQGFRIYIIFSKFRSDASFVTLEMREKKTWRKHNRR